MSIQGIYNEDGEPLGIEYIYEDEGDWYEDDYFIGDEGPFEGCCKRGDWDGVSEARTAEEAADGTRLWECVYCGTIGTEAELTNGGN